MIGGVCGVPVEYADRVWGDACGAVQATLGARHRNRPWSDVVKRAICAGQGTRNGIASGCRRILHLRQLIDREICISLPPEFLIYQRHDACKAWRGSRGAANAKEMQSLALLAGRISALACFAHGVG